MTFEQLTSDIIKRIPRKLTAVVLCIFLILDWASKQPDVNQTSVLAAVSIIAVAGIASHTITEWKNPTKENGADPEIK